VVVYALSEHGKPTSPLPDEPDQLVLFSLDGMNARNRTELAEAQARGEEYLYNWPVLGKVQVTDRGKVREILSAIRRAIRNPDKPANCFFPRHAVRAVKGGETVDVVICFQCRTYAVSRGPGSPLGSTPAISSDPEPLFDKILTDAGVPLAEK
jgi:hypothetical protein